MLSGTLPPDNDTGDHAHMCAPRLCSQALRGAEQRVRQGHTATGVRGRVTASPGPPCPSVGGRAAGKAGGQHGHAPDSPALHGPRSVPLGRRLPLGPRMQTPRAVGRRGPRLHGADHPVVHPAAAGPRPAHRLAPPPSASGAASPAIVSSAEIIRSTERLSDLSRATGLGCAELGCGLRGC